MTDGGVSKRRVPMIAAVLVILVLAAVTAWVRRPATGDSASSADRAGNGQAGPAATAGLEADGTDMGAVRRARVASAASPEDMQARIDESIARRTRLRKQRDLDSAKVLNAQVAAFRSERVDPAWAPQKETELGRIAGSPEISLADVSPKSLEVDCKRTICRLSGSFATTGAAEDWTLYYMSSVGAALPNPVVTRTQNPDGTIKVEIYGRAR